MTYSTQLWLNDIDSMGFFNRENHTFEPKTHFPDQKEFNYQKNVIDKCLYTSRVHDLRELSVKGNILHKILAKILLKKLADLTDDKDERNFLLKPEKYTRFTNETLRKRIKKWISGTADGYSIKNIRKMIPGGTKKYVPIKYWDVRDVTNMSKLFSVFTTFPPWFYKE